MRPSNIMVPPPAEREPRSRYALVKLVTAHIQFYTDSSATEGIVVRQTLQHSSSAVKLHNSHVFLDDKSPITD